LSCPFACSRKRWRDSLLMAHHQAEAGGILCRTCFSSCRHIATLDSAVKRERRSPRSPQARRSALKTLAAWREYNEHSSRWGLATRFRLDPRWAPCPAPASPTSDARPPYNGNVWTLLQSIIRSCRPGATRTSRPRQGRAVPSPVAEHPTDETGKNGLPRHSGDHHQAPRP
jgi:hypothetical protein